MSEWFKSKGRITVLFGALFLAVTIVAASFAVTMQNMAIDGKPSSSSGEEEPGSEAEPVDAPGENEPELADPEPEPEPAEPVFRVPSSMRGAFFTPGTDFLKAGADETTVKAEVDKAIDNAVKLTMNSLIILTGYEDRVIYRTADAPAVSKDFDIMEYIVSRCREKDLYTYAVFDASHYNVDSTASLKMSVGAGTINSLSANLREFAEKYRLDGILIDGYINKRDESSYKLYTLLGGAIGFENFMRQSPEAIVNAAARAVRKAAPNTQVGLLADAVWANDYEQQQGSATKAAFSALVEGNADTKAFVENGSVDFVAVKNYGSLTNAAEPFGEIAGWWAGVARSAGVPLYVVQASSKACTQEAGWNAHDQLARQAIELDNISGVRGAVFDSLQRLVENPKESTTTLIKYYKQEVQAEHILTELAVTKPEKTKFTTAETSVTFTGASDPNSAVTINGETISTDASGYFTVQKELVGGENKFVIVHKEKTITYVITREIEILKEITPQGALKADGSMDITITALAYHDAEVYASINNTKVKMEIDDSVVEEGSRDSSYKLFVGTYTAPPATSSEQNLGAITVTANWQSETKSLAGASVTINKKARIEDGVPVVVTAEQAMTYPANTLDNIPHPSYYPLPRGAMDYAVGDEITYVNYKGITYKFYVLASGLRVQSSDIQVSSDYASGNAVNGLSVSVENGFTYVVLPMTQKVSYTFSYKNDSVSILFHNTKKAPSSGALPKNPMFTEAVWSNNCTLDLKMVKSGGFMGYKGYYDDKGNLVLRFNNPPSSLSGARVVIDPGHGGKDTGALGFLANYPEKVINAAIASYLKAELEGRGASVKLLDPSGGMSLEDRVAAAEQYNADLFVSVHNNTASRASAVGTEVYYFYPFSKNLAGNAAAHVSGQLGTDNRGGRQSYYNVTLSSQFQSVLVECGFMSNKDEYEKLITKTYQQRIATGIADALAAAVKASYTGISGGDSTTAEPPPASTPSQPDPTPPPASSSTPSVPGVKVTGVMVSPSKTSMNAGASKTLSVEIYPANAGDKTVLWTSEDTSVATVDKNGKVTAVKKGSTRIVATTLDGGWEDFCTVTVDGGSASSTPSAPSGGDAKVEDVMLNKYSLILQVGASEQLEHEIVPENAANQTVSWSSSDTSVATVDANGVVKAVGPGEADITAKSNANSKISNYCTVTVSEVSAGKSVENADYVEFAASSYMVLVKKTLRLTVDSDIGTIRNSDFTWESDDTDILTVNGDGVVTAKSKEGSATVTAVSKDGYHEIHCDVEVTKTKVRVTEVKLSETNIAMLAGTKYSGLEWSVTPSGATNQTAKWSSSSSSRVSVENGVLSALKNGEADITLTVDGKTAKVRVTVIQPNSDSIDDLFICYDSYDLSIDDEVELEAEIDPYVVSDGNLFTWKSSDPSVASVNSKGVVKGLKKGKATITCILNANTSFTAKCVITVS